jgi:hypothetical protein
MMLPVIIIGEQLTGSQIVLELMRPETLQGTAALAACPEREAGKNAETRKERMIKIVRRDDFFFIALSPWAMVSPWLSSYVYCRLIRSGNHTPAV